MQIIAGQKRGAKLLTVQGQSVVRPTAQRTRESLFNILQGGKHLDEIAGLKPYHAARHVLSLSKNHMRQLLRLNKMPAILPLKIRCALYKAIA